MKTSQVKKIKSESGFALLLTLVVISVVLAVGLSLLQVTVKQLSLSSISRESTIALYTANTGVECIQYWRSIPTYRSEFLSGPSNPPTIQCADENPSWSETTTLIDGSSGRYLYNYLYRFDIDYGTAEVTDDVCLETSLYIADLESASADIDEDISSAGEGLVTLNCQAGGICTTIFSRGFNRPCDQLDSIFTVQRELTIEY